MSEKKWAVVLVQVDEKLLTKDLPRLHALSSLPDLLDGALDGASPSGALDLEGAYLLTEEQKLALIPHLERLSLPYHEYAVDVRGEVCREEDCAIHGPCVVIKLNDYRH